VINAGYAHDHAILARYAELTDAKLQPIDAATLADAFAELDLDEREDVHALVKVADLVLAPFKCECDVRRFSPVTLAALYSAGDDAAFVRTVERTKEVSDSLWSAVLDDLAADRTRSRYARLTLNYDNPMIRRLAQVDDRELLRRLLEVLYVQTLLLGHHPLSAAEMNLVNESLSGLMEWSLDRGGSFLQ
jgi:molecular chaperone HtpG